MKRSTARTAASSSRGKPIGHGAARTVTCVTLNRQPNPHREHAPLTDALARTAASDAVNRAVCGSRRALGFVGADQETKGADYERDSDNRVGYRELCVQVHGIDAAGS